MIRENNRGPDKLRKVKITRNYIRHAEGSCLIELGDTKVICNASLEDKVAPFLKGTGSGWITAEYGMLPRATATRTQRENSRSGPSGRTQEIQRLIGRSLRAVVDLRKIGERTIWIDCDVIQADGGTRTAAITGGFVALVDAFIKMQKTGLIHKLPLSGFVAATSVGVVDGNMLLDLSYAEDSKAEVDMNVIMTDEGKFIEVQGTAEREPFSATQMRDLLNLAKKGIGELIEIQKEVLKINEAQTYGARRT
jgi:ribonuclease PH